MRNTRAATAIPRWRQVTFRVLAILGAVVLGGFAIFFLVTTYLDDENEIHALHNLAGFAIYVPLVSIPLIAAVRDPGGSIASFRVAVAATVGIVVTAVIGGAIETAAISLVVVALLLWLHPRREEVLRLGALDVPLLALVAVAAIPAVAYGIDQADLQATRPDTDPHAEFEHYATMAGGALAFPLAGAVAAFRDPGDRLARWLVGLGAALLSAAFLLYREPRYVSVIEPAWAAAALVVSVLYLVVSEMVSRPPRRPA